MFIKSFRPQKFSEVVGEVNNCSLLLALAKNKGVGPSTIILGGSYGSGKTTCARLFAKALNCKNLKSDICCNCSSCNMNILDSPFYVEYDASVVGNVDSIRELRDTFFYKVSGYTRVVCLDEAHLLSRSCQSSLLKVFEETSEGVYFILSTTDVDKVLPTIRSRSLILNYSVKPKDLVEENIRTLSTQNNLNLSDKVISTIAVRSQGHMRNAHMLMDKALLLGNEKFLEFEESSYASLVKYTASIFLKNKEGVLKSVSDVLKSPVSSLKEDWQEFLLGLMRASVDGSSNDQNMSKLVTLLGPRVVQFVKLCLSDWVLKSFVNEVQLQCALLAIYQIVTKEGLR